jgi:hypothetical protein
MLLEIDQSTKIQTYIFLGRRTGIFIVATRLTQARTAKALEPGKPARAMRYVGEGNKKASTHMVTRQGPQCGSSMSLLLRGALAIGNAAASCSCQIPRVR